MIRLKEEDNKYNLTHTNAVKSIERKVKWKHRREGWAAGFIAHAILALVLYFTL